MYPSPVRTSSTLPAPSVTHSRRRGARIADSGLAPAACSNSTIRRKHSTRGCWYSCSHAVPMLSSQYHKSNSTWSSRLSLWSIMKFGSAPRASRHSTSSGRAFRQAACHSGRVPSPPSELTSAPASISSSTKGILMSPSFSSNQLAPHSSLAFGFAPRAMRLSTRNRSRGSAASNCSSSASSNFTPSSAFIFQLVPARIVILQRPRETVALGEPQHCHTIPPPASIPHRTGRLQAAPRANERKKASVFKKASASGASNRPPSKRSSRPRCVNAYPPISSRPLKMSFDRSTAVRRTRQPPAWRSVTLGGNPKTGAALEPGVRKSVKFRT